MWQLLLNLCFPKWCAGCGRFGTLWCAKCHNQLYFLVNPVPLKLEQPAFDRAWSVVDHTFPATKLVYQLKYQSVIDLAETVAEIMWLALPRPAAKVITSIPLHPARQRHRGFNQAAAIAEHLSQLWKLPYLELLERTRLTASQAQSDSRDQRLQQLSGTFAPSQLALKLRPPPPSVLIIDDVLTTGATLHQASLVLKQIGVKSITVATFSHGGG